MAKPLVYLRRLLMFVAVLGVNSPLVYAQEPVTEASPEQPVATTAENDHIAGLVTEVSEPPATPLYFGAWAWVDQYVYYDQGAGKGGQGLSYQNFSINNWLGFEYAKRIGTEAILKLTFDQSSLGGLSLSATKAYVYAYFLNQKILVYLGKYFTPLGYEFLGLNNFYYFEYGDTFYHFMPSDGTGIRVDYVVSPNLEINVFGAGAFDDDFRYADGVTIAPELGIRVRPKNENGGVGFGVLLRHIDQLHYDTILANIDAKFLIRNRWEIGGDLSLLHHLDKKTEDLRLAPASGLWHAARDTPAEVTGSSHGGPG